MEAELRLQQVKLDALTEDMQHVKASLSSIATSLSSLAVLEQKHIEARDGIKRAHDRIDRLQEDVKEELSKLQELVKDEAKGHETRIQKLELQVAKNAWIERVVSLAVMGILAMWAKGMF